MSTKCVEVLRRSVVAVALAAAALCGAVGCSGADDGAATEASQDEIRGSIGSQRAKDVARAYRAAATKDFAPIELVELPMYARYDVDTLTGASYDPARITAIVRFEAKSERFYVVEFAFSKDEQLVYFYDHKSERLLMSLSGDKKFTVIGTNETFEM